MKKRPRSTGGGRTILMVSDHSDPAASLGGEESGGQNVYVHMLSSRLAQKGHRVEVITRKNKPSLPEVEQTEAGYTVRRVPLGPAGFLPKEEFARLLPEFRAQVEDIARAQKYDIAHCHYWLSGAGALGLRELGIPVVQTFHSLGKMKHAALKGIDAGHMEFREKSEKKIVTHVDRIIAESAEERRMLIRHYNADGSKIIVIPAGVDIRQFQPMEKAKARRAIGIKKKNILLYVGRFVAQKGIPTLLQAYAQCQNALSPKERKDTVLLLVGGDLHSGTSKETRIQRRILDLMEALKLQSSVKVIGKIENDDLPVYYAAADACVVPSRYEPFGIVPLEAMACGTPVIASFVGGMKSTVRGLYTGFHARPEDSADFAYKMRLLLQNPVMREEFSANARQHVSHEYSWESVCDRILHAYNAVIDSHAR